MKDDEKEPDKAHDNAMEALTLFVSKFEPATLETADTFHTTNEIAQAIDEHTGVYLQAHEIYELMNQMGYKYEALNGLEFNWLLRKELEANS